MAETTTIQEVGHGTIAKYKLSAESSGLNLNDSNVKRWTFSVTGKDDTINITCEKVEDANGDIVYNHSGNVLADGDGFIVFIDTTKTGIGDLKGRVRMEVVDTDYIKPDSNENDPDRNVRPEVSLAFDVLKVS